MAQLAMFRVLRVCGDRPLVHQNERANVMWFEEIRPVAIKGQCYDRRDHTGIAHKAAKGGFHPVDGDRDPDRYTILPLQCVIKVLIAGFAFAPLRHDGREPTDLHEFAEAVTERLLVAIRRDGRS